LFADLPIGIHLLAKFVAGIDLAPHHVGLLGADKPGLSSAVYRSSQTEVGTMSSLGVGGTRAPGLAALDEAFGK